MKKLLPFLLICLTLHAKAQIVSIDEPNTYIPAELTGAKLGIGIAEFQKVNDTLLHQLKKYHFEANKIH